jgi:hypothetical protein
MFVKVNYMMPKKDNVDSFFGFCCWCVALNKKSYLDEEMVAGRLGNEDVNWRQVSLIIFKVEYNFPLAYFEPDKAFFFKLG